VRADAPYGLPVRTDELEQVELGRHVAVSDAGIATIAALGGVFDGLAGGCRSTAPALFLERLCDRLACVLQLLGAPREPGWATRAPGRRRADSTSDSSLSSRFRRHYLEVVHDLNVAAS
jgi:hypothetical protein